jgi:hypothetical protein
MRWSFLLVVSPPGDYEDFKATSITFPHGEVMVISHIITVELLHPA